MGGRTARRKLKGKLYKLQACLPVSEAARRLSQEMGEPVTLKQVLRLSLDGHLTLSVNLVNGTLARRGRFP